MLQNIRKSRGGFTLVEIMIVVAIIALLAAIAVPGFLRSRKRSQATAILNDARIIDGAIDQYAIENNKHRLRHGDRQPAQVASSSPTAVSTRRRGNGSLTDILGNGYTYTTFDGGVKVAPDHQR